jgi:hypothetical protein
VTKRNGKSASSHKSREKSPSPGWFTVGGPQGPGRGPAKGNGGRPPDEFKAFLQTLRDNPTFRARLEDIALNDPDPDRFLKAAHWLAERTEGKPVQPIEHAGGVTLTWEERRQRLDELLGEGARRIAHSN